VGWKISWILDLTRIAADKAYWNGNRDKLKNNHDGVPIGAPFG
jgi:hypothetical protein